MLNPPLISTAVAGLVLAFILGALARHLRLPPFVGYLVAGLAVGPHMPGLSVDPALAADLAQIGLVLLLFGVGLHFPLHRLATIRLADLPGALLRLAGGMGLGLVLGLLLGWPPGAGLILGLALAVASAATALRVLEDRHVADGAEGRIVTGWLAVELLVVVLAVVLLPAFAGPSSVPADPFVNIVERTLGQRLDAAGIAAVTLVKLLAFAGFMLVVGRRLVPALLGYAARTGSRELLRLALPAAGLGIAVGTAALFGTGLPLGALLAGMILGESPLSRQAARDSLPFRDAYGVLFFIGLGMLFDPAIFLAQPLALAGALLVVVAGKALLGLVPALAFGRPAGPAIGAAATLAQIGELSLVLALAGVAAGLLPDAARDLVVATACLSILVNPLLVWLAARFQPLAEARLAASERTEPGFAPRPAAPDDGGPATALKAHTVLVGFGEVGAVVARGLLEAGRPFILIDDADAHIADARALGIEVIAGNAAGTGLLDRANIAGASTLVVAIADAFEAGQVIAEARRRNADLFAIARAHSAAEADYLAGRGVSKVILGAREIGAAMLDLVAHGRKDAATAAVLDAVEAAIKADPTPSAPSSERPTLTGIDEAALARAFGVPDPVPAAAPADMDYIDVEHVELAPEPAPESVPESEAEPVPEPAPFGGRRPARKPATPFNPEVPPPGETP